MTRADPPPGEDGVPAGQPAGRTVAIVVNGDARSMPAGSTAHDLVVLLGLAGRPLAVEINERVVPRSSLADCRLSDGDRLELVTLVGGG